MIKEANIVLNRIVIILYFCLVQKPDKSVVICLLRVNLIVTTAVFNYNEIK